MNNTASGVYRGYVPPASSQTGRQQGYPSGSAQTGIQQGYPPVSAQTGRQQGYPPAPAQMGQQQGYPPVSAQTGRQQGYPPVSPQTGRQQGYPPTSAQAGPQDQQPKASRRNPERRRRGDGENARQTRRQAPDSQSGQANGSQDWGATGQRGYITQPIQKQPAPAESNRHGAAENPRRSRRNPGNGNQEWGATGQRGYMAPVPPPPEKPRKKKGAGKIVLTVLLVLVLAAGLGVGGTYAYGIYAHNKLLDETVDPYDNLFVPGVYVDGISLGGMTAQQAKNSVESQILERNNAWKVYLTYQGETMAEINAQMLNMSVDIGAVLNNAWLQGHTGDKEERYAAMMQLQEKPYHGYTAVPSGNNAVIDSLLNEIREKIDTPAKNAVMTTFDTNLDYPFVFEKEQTGRRLDTEPVIEKLYQMVSEMESGSVELEPEILQPTVKEVDLQKHYMLRSSVYTPISTSSTEERNNNIRRAFEFVDGYILNVGESFSFNNVVGQRTEENGFYPAVEYAYNEHVMGIGGGVCQASSTIYQAAICAGLTVTKREPHSDAVNYTEYGKDATVYWVGKRKIDLVFLNNTEDPIFLVAAVQKDPSNKRRLIAKVSIYGADMGDVRYEIASEVLAELDPPENPVYVKDTEGTYVYYTGQQKSVSKAQPGYVVRSYRLEYTGNELTNRKELYTDTYEPKPERIYVGTHSN